MTELPKVLRKWKRAQRDGRGDRGMERSFIPQILIKPHPCQGVIFFLSAFLTLAVRDRAQRPYL